MLVIVILVNIIILKQAKSEISNRSWFHPCFAANCLYSIEKCIETNCLGNKQCIDCVTKNRFFCNSCANEVFNEANLFRGELVCSINDRLQESVCQLYCRGQFKNKGKCERSDKQIPRCLCNNEEVTTVKQLETTINTFMTTTTTTKIRDIDCKYSLTKNLQILNNNNNNNNY
jgi:hypothetical protein